jgi:UDP-glucose 4-epimerase
LKGKQVIVTGGLGFIDSHLVEKLVENNDVAIIDNLSTGKFENVSHLTMRQHPLNGFDYFFGLFISRRGEHR